MAKRMSNADMAAIALGLRDELTALERTRVKPAPKKRDDELPKAPPPPTMTPEIWARSCVKRGRRCGSCDLCTWEREAELWHQQSEVYQRALRASLPYAEQPTIFRRVDQALIAYRDWEMHNRWSPSAMGPLMDRLEQGATHGQAGTSYSRDKEDPFLRRATDVIEVQQAVAHAFEGNRWGLEARECIAMLVARVGHVRETLPKYEEMELRFKLPAELIKSIVRHGRRGITVELAARGVIPMPAAGLGLHYDVDVRRRELGART